jgi:hypothetical protein
LASSISPFVVLCIILFLCSAVTVTLGICIYWFWNTLSLYLRVWNPKSMCDPCDNCCTLYFEGIHVNIFLEALREPLELGSVFHLTL